MRVKILSPDRMAITGGIRSRQMVLQLAFDVAQKRGSAKPKKVGLQPSVAQFFLDECQIDKRVLCLGNSPCRFVTHAIFSAFEIIPNGPDHHKRHGQRCVHAFLSRRCLHEIGARHHANQRGARNIA